MIVRVDNGKYTFITGPSGRIEILRGGAPWTGIDSGVNAVWSALAELDAARVVIAAARELESRLMAPPVLADALRAHKELVDDNEKPSEWAVAK